MCASFSPSASGIWVASSTTLRPVSAGFTRSDLLFAVFTPMVSRKPLGVEGERPFRYKGETLWLYYDESCPGINAENPETTITPEEIAELGLEFEREFEKTDMDGFARLIERLEI